MLKERIIMAIGKISIPAVFLLAFASLYCIIKPPRGEMPNERWFYILTFVVLVGILVTLLHLVKELSNAEKKNEEMENEVHHLRQQIFELTRENNRLKH